MKDAAEDYAKEAGYDVSISIEPTSNIGWTNKGHTRLAKPKKAITKARKEACVSSVVKLLRSKKVVALGRYNYQSYIILLSMTYNRSKVGQKGQVVIPKDIRNKAGIRAGSEVVVEMRGDDEVVIKRSSPATQSYVDYYIVSYSKKLKRSLNVKKIIEEESVERTRVR